MRHNEMTTTSSSRGRDVGSINILVHDSIMLKQRIAGYS